MARKMADCRRYESDMNCSLVIIGDEEEVVAAAVAHAVDSHGHEDTEELRAMTRRYLEDADDYVAGPRAKEAFPA